MVNFGDNTKETKNFDDGAEGGRKVENHKIFYFRFIFIFV